MFDATLAGEAPIVSREPHVLLMVADQKARYELADALLDAGFRLTLASSPTMAGPLLEADGEVDLIVSAHTVGAREHPALTARAARPNVPLLLVEADAAGGPGVVRAARQAMRRWPVSR